MNKLKNKVFVVIFSILTIFLITILSIFNFQNYKSEENRVRQSLMNANDMNNKDRMFKPDDVNDDFKNNDDKPMKFMDALVYTVLLNDDNSINDIINHTNNTVDENDIINIANNYLNKNNNDGINIGNLYINNYSYLLTKGKSLIIVDISNVKNNLDNNIKISLYLFIILEIIIIFISLKITDWIIKPVIESFNKQKQFIADASHELKTPLAVIIASADSLKENNKYVNNIKNESERMSNLIKKLLNLARLEDGINKDNYVTSNISKAIQLTCLTYESLMFENNLKLDMNIEDNINFKCNVDEIKQLAAILLDNAIKHGNKDSTINVLLKKYKNEITFSVSNYGDEIPKEVQTRIFERFYRGDASRNRNDNRYGLGLAIAKSIVNNHGGKITVNSSNGITTFKVIFKQI